MSIAAKPDGLGLGVNVLIHDADELIDQFADASLRDPQGLLDALRTLALARAEAEDLEAHSRPDDPDPRVDAAHDLVALLRQDVAEVVGDDALLPFTVLLNEKEARGVAKDLLAAADTTLTASLRGAA